MAYYFIAQIFINDENEYQKYLSETDQIFKKYNGEYLVVDDQPEILEGEWNYTRSVVIKFDNRVDFQKWYFSDEYQNILKYRLNAAKSDSILAKGLKIDEK